MGSVMATTTNRGRFNKGKDRFYQFAECLDPSVTSITSVLAKPALVNWSGKLNRERTCDEAAALYDEIGERRMPADWFRSSLWSRVERRVFHNEEAKAAADLGTLAHERCEWVVRRRLGQPVGADPITVVAAGAGTIPPKDLERALWSSLAFEDWLGKNRVEPIASEVVVHHLDHHYAGTTDLVARVNGEVAIIDLKTSSAIWNDMHLQVAAYLSAYNSEVQSNEQATTAYILRLPKKLTDPEFEAVEITDLDGHLSGFLHLLGAWRWQAGMLK